MTMMIAETFEINKIRKLYNYWFVVGILIMDHILTGKPFWVKFGSQLWLTLMISLTQGKTYLYIYWFSFGHFIYGTNGPAFKV